MNKKLIIIFVFIISILITGAFLVINSKNNKEIKSDLEITDEKSTPIETVEVSLTESGFTPNEIRINKNTKIIWINSSDRAATVDSNPHPIHTSFTDLNLGEFNVGEKLEFIFKEPGEYKYHNHYNESEEGIIIVE